MRLCTAADGQTLGIGAGQMSRVDSARIAAVKGAHGGAEPRRLGGRLGRLLPLSRRTRRRRRQRRGRGDPAGRQRARCRGRSRLPTSAASPMVFTGDPALSTLNGDRTHAPELDAASFSPRFDLLPVRARARRAATTSGIGSTAGCRRLADTYRARRQRPDPLRLRLAHAVDVDRREARRGKPSTRGAAGGAARWNA